MLEYANQSRIDPQLMASIVNDRHDAFFKHTLSDPELAGTFLREHLPKELANLLGSEPLEPIPGSFVDEDLKQHHSDLVFSVPLKSGKPAFAYVLMEHKSAPDRGARLQLLRYIVRLLTQWYEQHNKQLPLPTVFPVLVHQGPPGWDSPFEFSELFGPVSDSLRPYLPSFRHALVDLTQADDETLSGQVRLRSFLKALKYSRRADLAEHLYIIFADAAELDDQDLAVIVTYLETSPAPVDRAALHEVLHNLIPTREEKVMRWITQESFDEGMAKGKAEGNATLLIHLIRRRFGSVSEKDLHRIADADAPTLEAWFMRALDAPNLDSVFVSH